MAPLIPLLPLLLGAMHPAALAMAADCGSTPPAADGPAAWVRSWLAPSGRRPLGDLPLNDGGQATRSASETGPEQSLEADSGEPAFCPLSPPVRP